MRLTALGKRKFPLLLLLVILLHFIVDIVTVMQERGGSVQGDTTAGAWSPHCPSLSGGESPSLPPGACACLFPGRQRRGGRRKEGKGRNNNNSACHMYVCLPVISSQAPGKGPSLRKEEVMSLSEAWHFKKQRFARDGMHLRQKQKQATKTCTLFVHLKNDV